MISAKHRFAATRAINDSTGIIVEDSALDLGIGEGLEAWIHESSHFVLLFGCLLVENIENIPDREYFVSATIDDRKTSKGPNGKYWGVDQELKTLAVELLVADSIGYQIDELELVLYAVENNNLDPRWRASGPSKDLRSAKNAVKEIEKACASSEVLEAAAYLSRAIWRHAS